jgi:hypothetical protein
VFARAFVWVWVRERASERWRELEEWRTYTPEGRRLLVRREGETWVARCGEGQEARSELLDLALIEAIHRDHDVVGHVLGIDYGKWTRERADSIEREYIGGP